MVEGSAEFTTVCEQLKLATQLCRRATRRIRVTKRHALIEELWSYWRERRLAECHRVLQALSGSKQGSKRRTYSALKASFPSQEQWVSLLSLDGGMGGMLATQTSWSDMLSEHAECAEESPELSMDHVEQGRTDVFRLRKHALRAGKRKSSPCHSVPVEVLAMILAPNRNISDKKFGIGVDKSSIIAPATWRAFEKGYAMINRTGYTPLKWHFSWSACLKKPNGLSGPRGQRTVHRLDCQGKAFYCEKMKHKAKETPLPVSNMTQGFYFKRRREAAVWCQQSSAYRARRCGRSGILANLDQSNAFGSTTWETLDSVTSELFEPQDFPFVGQRFRWSSVQVSANDGDLFIRPKVGALMGDLYAVQSFLGSFEKPSNLWNFSHVFILGGADARFFIVGIPLMLTIQMAAAT